MQRIPGTVPAAAPVQREAPGASMCGAVLPDNYIVFPTGSSLLNTYMARDTGLGGFASGTISNVVGDSGGGKTLLALSCFAEMAKNPKFNDYRFIFDDAEHALAFDLETMFGAEVARRIEPPREPRDANDNGSSATVEEWMDNMHAAGADGRPFFYVLDSLDALPSEDELDQIEDERKARQGGKETSGSYGTAKAKRVGQAIRTSLKLTDNTSSHIMILSQTRDKIGGYGGKGRSGGKGLQFFSSHVLWVSIKASIKRTVNKMEFEVGRTIEVLLDKNKTGGIRRKFLVNILDHYGIDDLLSMLQYLEACGCIGHEIDPKTKKPKKSSLHFEELGLTGVPDTIIKRIEENGWESRVQSILVRWVAKVEKSVLKGRKPRYA